MPPTTPKAEKLPSEVIAEHIARAEALRKAKTKVLAEYNEVRNTLRMLTNSGLGTDEQRAWVASEMPVIKRERRNGKTEDSESAEAE